MKNTPSDPSRRAGCLAMEFVFTLFRGGRFQKGQEDRPLFQRDFNKNFIKVLPEKEPVR